MWESDGSGKVRGGLISSLSKRFEEGRILIFLVRLLFKQRVFLPRDWFVSWRVEEAERLQEGRVSIMVGEFRPGTERCHGVKPTLCLEVFQSVNEGR